MNNKKHKQLCLFLAAYMAFANVTFADSVVDAKDALDTKGNIYTAELSKNTASIKEQLNSADIKQVDTANELARPNANDKVTIIVELNEAPISEDAGFGAATYMTSSRAKSRINRLEASHDKVKAEFENILDNSMVSDYALDSADQETVPASTVEFGYDYYVALNGFSVTTEYRNLDVIKELDGVKNAFVSGTYSAPELQTPAEPNMATSTGMVGANIVNKTGYTGKGTVVAVIDTGLDTDHEAFATAPEEGRLSKEDVENTIAIANLSAKDVDVNEAYVSEKIPYVYDYVDKDGDVNPVNQPGGGEHGTHVAGTVAANCDKLVGIAPDAQLLIMKVFSDKDGYTNDEALCAAVDDAMKLGADSINMSIGSTCGFVDEARNGVYNSIKDRGVNFAISAGNSNNSAENNEVAGVPFAADPDYSTLGSPSVYTEPMSVASMVNTYQANVPYFTTTSAGAQVFFNEASIDGGKTVADTLNGEYELVPCGLGSTEDVEKAGDLTGKIALIKRGGLTFTEKANNAVDAGAVAVVIYNNTVGTISMSVDEKRAPVMSISQENGEELAAAGVTTVTFDPANIGSAPCPDAYQMSSFSSWGCTPDLKLKPEITAPGENIYSSVLDGKFELMSGTSMASPHVAGMFALMKQYVNDKYPNLTTVQKYELINNLMMSTAEPAKDPDGNNYSPRKQGSGLARVDLAMQVDAYLSTNKSHKPKAELGASEDGSFTFDVTVHNLSSEEQSYTLDASALVDKIEELAGFKLNALASEERCNDGINVSFSDDEVTVAGKGTATVTVNISLTDAMKAELDENFENGTFVEGFIYFKGQNDAVDLSVPYMGFYGDWAKAPTIDSSIYEDVQPHQLQSAAYNSGEGKSYFYGFNFLDLLVNDPEEAELDPEKIAISPNSIVGLTALSTQTGLLRNAKDLTYEITDAEGNVVKSWDYENMEKSFYYSNAGVIVWPEAFLGEDGPEFDGTDEYGNELAEGKYTYTVKARPDGTPKEESSYDTWSVPVAYDKTPGEVLDAEVTKEDGKTVLTLVTSDNEYLSGFQIGYNGYYSNALVYDDPVLTEDGVNYYAAKIDITPLVDEIDELVGTPADKLSIDLYDYAMNGATYEIKMDGTTQPSPSPSPSATPTPSVRPGDDDDEPSPTVAPTKTPAPSTKPTPSASPVPSQSAAPSTTTAPTQKPSVESTKIVLKVGSTVVTVNGTKKTIDAAPVIKKSTTYVPLRFISETFDSTVKYDNKTKMVTITDKAGKVVTVKADVIVNGRTLVPIRFVAEKLGAKVDWTAATKQITITK